MNVHGLMDTQQVDGKEQVPYSTQLGKVRYFTKLNLRSSYYHDRIEEGDELKIVCDLVWLL